MDTSKLKIQPVLFSKHEYDIDLVEIYKRICLTINRMNSFNEDFDKSKYLKKQRDFIEFYCQKQNIDFQTYPIIVVDSSKPIYPNFLALSLIFYDIHKIGFFLDAQKEKYKPNEVFENLIEFQVYQLVKQDSPFENSNRLEKIIQWISEKKKFLNYNPNIKKGNNPATKPFLEWLHTRESLKFLSKRLHLKGFTENQFAFEKVFKEKKEMTWLKEPEFLVYLLELLYSSKSPKYYKTSAGKGYLSIAQLYFCKDLEKLAKKIIFQC